MKGKILRMAFSRLLPVFAVLCLVMTGCAKGEVPAEESSSSRQAPQVQDSTVSEPDETSSAPQTAVDTRILREENYSDGALSGYTDYLYDPQEKLIRKEFRTADGALDFQKEYLYDENGRLKEEYVIRDGKKSPKSTVYHYTEDGLCRLEETQVKVSDDEIQVNLWDEFSYDDQGRQTHRLRWKEGEFSFEERYIYDADGNLTRGEIRDCDGCVTSVTEHQYDEEGHLLRTVTRRGEEETVTEYDWSEDFMRCGTESIGYDGKADGAVVNTYDGYGRLILSERFRLDGTVADSVKYIYVK